MLTVDNLHAGYGASEVLMPALHPAEIWKKSGRYETLGADKIACSIHGTL